jgi:hypothetical protein
MSFITSPMLPLPRMRHTMRSTIGFQRFGRTGCGNEPAGGLPQQHDFNKTERISQTTLAGLGTPATLHTHSEVLPDQRFIAYACGHPG